MDYRSTYYSVQDAGAEALPFIESEQYYGALKQSWSGIRTIGQLKKLVRVGWEAEAAEALGIAESAVEAVQQDRDMPDFRATWDVSGCEVDVARYLSGVPENMIDYEMTSTSRAGRVIVLCASVCYSAAVKPATIKRRGHGIAALAFALSRMGLGVELWADFSILGVGQRGGPVGSCRVLVKGTNDELDPARIMFAYAHPGMSRSVMMPAMHSWSDELKAYYEIGGAHGRPTDPIEDLPDGAIYLPSVYSDRDVPNAKELLIEHLSELGLIGLSV